MTYNNLNEKINRIVSRASNFSKCEERMLIRIVNNHPIVKGTRTDVATNIMKHKEWEKVAAEFNLQNLGREREAKTLRRKYENMKKLLKKKVATERKIFMLTGGGSTETPIYNDEEQNFMSVLGPQAAGLTDHYGGDSELPLEHCMEITIKTEPTDLDGSTIESSGAAESSCHDDAPPPVEIEPNSDPLPFAPTPPTSLLKTPRPALNTRMFRLSDRLSAWAQCKVNNTEAEDQRQMERHEQYMRHKEEEHSWKREEYNRKRESDNHWKKEVDEQFQELRKQLKEMKDLLMKNEK